ncbi:MAG: MGMT family protein [Clostridia bacterium]|nr:MGMT family protein [Clostridia bacterium]
MHETFDRQRLYELLRTVPRGRVVTYKTLASMLGNPAWARAVGNALHKNPDGDRYPCYRVVSSRGALSQSYAFGGIEEQKRRLEADGITVTDCKVDLAVYQLRNGE